MSRSVRDLRELVCVSRLTYVDSDDDTADWSDEDRRMRGLPSRDGGSNSPASSSGSGMRGLPSRDVGDNGGSSSPASSSCSGMRGLPSRDVGDNGGSNSPASSSGSGSAHLPGRLRSTDSGFMTNGSTVDRSEGAPATTSTAASGAAAAPPSAVASGAKPRSKTKPSKRKRKKAAEAAAAAEAAEADVCLVLPPQHNLPRPPLLPPVRTENYMFPGESSRPIGRENQQGIGARRGGRAGARRGEPTSPQRGNFDPMLTYMDASVVAEWLTRANQSLADLTAYCCQGDNFVQFAHFWLSDFPDKYDIYEMEHQIMLEELGHAFAMGRAARKVFRHDLDDLIRALMREYPDKLLGTKGSYLFLDHLDVLTSDRAERYKLLLADVRCSTQNRQYAQWLLATRSFGLVSMWSAVVNFYRNLLCQHGYPQGLPAVPVLGSSGGNVHQRRLLHAVR